MTVLVHDRTELASALASLNGPVGLVATMGALHAGHAANISTARATAAAVVVSIFINPMQFDRAADLQRYPQTLTDDLAMCSALGVDVVWAPQVPHVYPDGPVRVRISSAELGADLEGASRPGHFDGVLTVVGKIFGLVRPDYAFFGEKDYQQLVVIRQMVADLELGVNIVAVPTVRDADGLALSSRNVFLSVQERLAALKISAALAAAASTAGTAHSVLEAARRVLDQAPSLKVDYLQLRGPQLGPAPATGQARLLIAAYAGATRLIDNCAIELSCAP